MESRLVKARSEFEELLNIAKKVNKAGFWLKNNELELEVVSYLQTLIVGLVMSDKQPHSKGVEIIKCLFGTSVSNEQLIKMAEDAEKAAGLSFNDIVLERYSYAFLKSSLEMDYIAGDSVSEQIVSRIESIGRSVIDFDDAQDGRGMELLTRYINNLKGFIDTFRKGGISVAEAKYQDGKSTVENEESKHKIDNTEDLVVRARREYEVIVNIAKKILIVEGDSYNYPEVQAEDEVFAFMQHFMIGLIMADEQVHSKEVEILNGVLGVSFFTKENVVNQFNSNESDNHCSYYSFMLKQWDDSYLSKAWDLYPPDDVLVSISGHILEKMENIGRCVLAVDGNQDEREIELLTKYILKLRKYVQKNKKERIKIVQKSPTEISSVFKQEEKRDIHDTEDENLDKLLQELNDLIGLSTVKIDVQSIINLIRVRKLRQERNMEVPQMSLHLVFTGNPGTGKTSVARLLAKIYQQLGLLSKGHLVEVDRSGFVGGYVGQTALKVKEVVNKALGGVLFIDEAYALSRSGESDNDYGKEAIDTLLKAMEDNRENLIVIVAGYSDLMEGFLSSNPGIRSRFNKYIKFEDYGFDELLLILMKLCEESGYSLASDANNYVGQFFKEVCATKDKDFGNGRMVRNFFEKSISNQSNRVVTLKDPTDEDLRHISLEDVEKVVKEGMLS